MKRKSEVPASDNAKRPKIEDKDDEAAFETEPLPESAEIELANRTLQYIGTLHVRLILDRSSRAASALR